MTDIVSMACYFWFSLLALRRCNQDQENDTYNFLPLVNKECPDEQDERSSEHRKGLGEANELTTTAYSLLKATDWQSIVAGAQYLTEADDRLRDWLGDHCIT